MEYAVIVEKNNGVYRALVPALADLSRDREGPSETTGRGRAIGQRMKLYVLDTSVVGFAKQQNPVYLHHLQNLPAGTPVANGDYWPDRAHLRRHRDHKFDRG